MLKDNILINARSMLENDKPAKAILLYEWFKKCHKSLANTILINEKVAKCRIFGKKTLLVEFKCEISNDTLGKINSFLIDSEYDVYIEELPKIGIFQNYCFVANLPSYNEKSIRDFITFIITMMDNFGLSPWYKKSELAIETITKQLIENNYLFAVYFNIYITCGAKILLDEIRENNSRTISCLKNRPLLSIIIPVYNNGQYIKECITSIKKQTLTDYEIIIVNDGSDDNSLQIIKDIKNNEDKIKIINQKNSGPAISRNKGLELSSGKFVAFLDSDDFWIANNAIEKIISYAEKEKLNISGGNVFRFMDGEIIKSPDKKMNFWKYGIHQYSDYQFDYGYWRFIYNNNFLKKNNLYFPNYRRFQDPPFFVKTMLTSEVFGMVNTDFYCWRVGYKSSDMNYAQVCGLINGLTDNLLISGYYKMAMLHNLCIARINYDTYRKQIKKNLNEYIIKRLKFFSDNININLLNHNGYKYNTNYQINILKEI